MWDVVPWLVFHERPRARVVTALEEPAQGHGLLGPRDVDPFQAHDNCMYMLLCCTTVLHYVYVHACVLLTYWL